MASEYQRKIAAKAKRTINKSGGVPMIIRTRRRV